MVSIKKAVKRVMPINGWVREDWLETLGKHAMTLPKGATLVEIGTAMGRSSTFFGLIRPDLKIYTLDNYTDWYYRTPHEESLEEFQQWHKDVIQKQYESYGVTNVEHIIADSNTYKWDKGPIDMLYWDGGTSYETVKKDYEVWFPLIKEGGLFVFGSYLFEPKGDKLHVRRFIQELDLPMEIESNIAAITK